MTPEREAYLAKCNAKERRLRDLIQSGKSAVKRLKGYLRTSTDYPRTIQLITLRSIITELLAFRHELARLKGMDRVVVPRNFRECNSSITGYFATCKCGRDLSWERSCPNCGRHILWGKVK